MDELLEELQRGDITFDAFYRQTEGAWRAMATTQFKRMGWRLQGSADLDDVFQEMVMSVPQSLKDYDESRSGMGLKRFVVWRAFTAAKDFINQQCGAYKGRTCEPPRAPVTASMVNLPRGHSGADSEAQATVDNLFDRLSAVDADQDWSADLQARRDAVCQTLVDHVVMTSLLEVGGSLQQIADAIYAREDLRTELELGSRSKTYGMVRRATVRFVDRAAGMA